MTDLLFQTDSYMKEFNAKIVKIFPDENAVVLNRTAFYPGGGGQPSDIGTIVGDKETFIVSKVKKQNGYILHFIEGKLPKNLASYDFLGKVVIVYKKSELEKILKFCINFDLKII